jgi:hypothetical protein
MPAPLSRRDLLTRSTTLAALGAGALAGCAELDVLGGSGPALRDAMRRWLPAPETLPSTDSPVENYFFQGVDLAAVRSAPDRFGELVLPPREEMLSPLGVTPANVDVSMTVAFSMRVHLGEIDVDAVAETLRAEGFERAGEDGDVRLFRGHPSADRRSEGREGSVHWVGVGDSSVVYVPWMDRGDETVGALLGANRGDVRRHAESDDGVEALIRAGDGLMGINGSSTEPVREPGADPAIGTFPGMVASGGGFDAAGESVRLHTLAVFEDAGSVPADSFDAYVDEQTAPPDDESVPNYTHHETTVDGRVARIVLEADTAELPTPASS